MKLFYIEFQDRDIEVTAEFVPAENGGYDSPSYPAEYVIQGVYFKLKEISSYLSEDSWREIDEIINN